MPSACKPLIIAHRGASKDAPENTLAAFRLAWERGARAVELDVRLSRDGHAVVIHDASTRRVAGVDRPVAEQELAELGALDAGSWKGARWAGERIPRLSEALATMPAGARLVIEIKSGPATLPAVARALAEGRTPPEAAEIITFDIETARHAKRLWPERRVLGLAAVRKEEQAAPPAVWLDPLLALARELRLDGLDLGAFAGIDGGVAARVKEAGLCLYVWTVNDPSEGRRLAAAGVDAITTDCPEVMLRELG
jgi:glycerophosphoryl diester phosphodiesterase